MSIAPYGTSPIKCGNEKCDWTGKETDLIHHPDDAEKFRVRNVCPKCYCDGYMFARRKSVHSAQLFTEISKLQPTQEQSA